MKGLNKERHEEVSDKLLKMGQALINEGDETGDYVIQSTGNFIMLLSGIMNNAIDMKTVADLLAMFSAKKILDGQITNEGTTSSIDELEDIFKNMRYSLENEDEDEYYEDEDEDEYYEDEDEDEDSDPNGRM